MEKKNGFFHFFTNGILKENPVLRLMLGICPTLAVTTALTNGIGMGVAATFVLVCSNVVISLLRKVIPSQVRLPAFIIIIATFVTVVQMFVKAYFPALNESLGIYLPLITVNCIILGRAEMFASKHGVAASALDGLGSGIGFTIVLVLISAVRELLGAGTLAGFQILPSSVPPLTIMLLPAGGFFVFACVMALAVFIETKMGKKPTETIGCQSCPSHDECTANGGK